MFGSNPRKNPSLPQNDSPAELEKREEQLAKTQMDYVWDDAMANVVGVPMSQQVPSEDKPTIAWFMKVIDVALEIVVNTIANAIDDDSDDAVKELKSIQSNLEDIKKSQQERDDTDHDSWLENTLSRAKQLLSTDIGSATAELQRLKKIVDSHPVSETVASQKGLAPFKGLFETIKLNPVAESFQLDATFAHYRVAGPNPMLITCVSAIPDKFKVDNTGYQTVMGDQDSLDAALADKRIFLLDYEELQLIVDNPGEYDGLPKQLFAPIALFARKKGGDDLIPVAIQRSQTIDAAGVVYATTDSSNPNYWPWQTAKSIVQMADGNYHELFVHLARTHLFIEAFTVATNRNLAENHPINILLIPHFEGTLFINSAAASSLIAAGGPIDHIFAGEISFTQQAAGNDRLNYDFYANMLPADLENRGVNDTDILPNYPYRDDGMLVWNAIKEWATQYVNIYYAHDNDVIGDTELAAWAADLTAQGKIKGFKPIESKTQLVDVLTMIMFTSSAQHAAVNFPQSPLMTFGPAISGSIWGDNPPKGETQDEWLDTLLPISLAKEQLNLLHLLGGVYYRQLGEYRTNDFPYLEWFADKQITGKGNALDRYQAALAKVEETITERNKTRDIPYTFLMPSKIPMSINI